VTNPLREIPPTNRVVDGPDPPADVNRLAFVMGLVAQVIAKAGGGGGTAPPGGNTANLNTIEAMITSGWPSGGGGTQGPAGPPNVLTVSGTTTGAAGTNASVTISGTSPAQSLAFTIPRGDTGEPGEPGGGGGGGALVAIGPTPPSPAQAGMLWFDTTQETP
jgi:hypothetical protein